MNIHRLSSIACAVALCVPALAVASTSAPLNLAGAKPTDEASLMSRLGPKGFIDFNSYRTTADGGAVLQALNGNTGALDTIEVKPDGSAQLTPGWQLTQGENAGSHASNSS
jgi:hypothetical protein